MNSEARPTGAASRASVSVCIATCNRAALLRESLASLVAQTMPDFELLIVDNASVDETAEVVHRVRDRRIRYVRNPTNLGSRGNWNRCLELSRGDYVAICHDDDIYAPTFVEESARFLDRHPSVGFVHCDAIWTEQTGEQTMRFAAYPSDRVLPSREIFRHYLLNSHNVVLSSVMARRAAYDRVGLYRTQFLTADYDMWLRMAAYFDVGYISRPLVRYRRHGASTSRTMPASRWYEEHRTIVDDALPLAAEAFGHLPATREEIMNHVRRRWARRHFREALSRIAHGNPAGAREYVDAATPLATEFSLRLRVRLARLLLSSAGTAVLRTLAEIRGALRRYRHPDLRHVGYS